MRSKRHPREARIPGQHLKLIPRGARAIAVEFTKSDRKKYTVTLATLNPKVNFADEICYLGNLINLGKRPPRKETFVEISKPSGWRRLRGRYYARTRREFNRLLKLMRAGKPYPHAWRKVHREKKRPRKKRRVVKRRRK